MSFKQVPQSPALLASLSDVSITSATNGEVLTYQSSTGKWVNNPVAGLVTGVSNTDGTLTISPTTGAVVASLNLGNANIWTATQTFGAGLTVSVGVITFDTVPQTSQGGFTSNTFYGTGAGAVNSGNNNNSFFGYEVGLANTTGRANSFFGFQAGLANTTGNNNSFFGFQAGSANTTGDANSFFGLDAGHANTTGNDNSFFGFEAGFNFNDATSSADYLVLVGYQAGFNYTGTERNNIVVGANVSGILGESNIMRLGSVITTSLASPYLTTFQGGITINGDLTGTTNLILNSPIGGAILLEVNGSTIFTVTVVGGGLGLSSSTGFSQLSGVSNAASLGINFGVAFVVRNNAEFEITVLTPVNMFPSYSPAISGNYLISGYFRVTVASTIVTVTLTYKDVTGTQTITFYNAVSLAVGSYTIPVTYINASSTGSVVLTLTAGTINQVYASGTLMGI